MTENKISVLLIEPNKYPKMIEIDDTLEAMQHSRKRNTRLVIYGMLPRSLRHLNCAMTKY